MCHLTNETIPKITLLIPIKFCFTEIPKSPFNMYFLPKCYCVSGLLLLQPA